MRLYHTTNASSAGDILRSGFRDPVDDELNFARAWMLSAGITGVFFADRPVGVDEGAKEDPILGAPVFVIELDEAAIADYEIIEEEKPYREWCIPAELANQSSRRIIYDPQDDADPDAPWWETA